MLLMHITLMPVFVAALTASSSLSYFGLKATVKAQSMIRPTRKDEYFNDLLHNVLKMKKGELVSDFEHLF